MKSRSRSSNRGLFRTSGIQAMLLIIMLMITGCNAPSVKDQKDTVSGRLLPKVLFITSGISDEEPQPAQGIIVALQSFNKRGVPVRLEPRDILYNYREMSRYAIIILSTFPGYHDADRRY